MVMATVEIHGSCAPGYEPVRDVFLSHFEQGLEVGASVAVTRDGASVVDLWAGAARPDGTPWSQDTIVNVYSTTKTMAATTVLMLADRGEIDLDAPVARYWPEFAQNGKDGVLVRHVMSHSAGLSGFDPPLRSVEQLYDGEAICDALARQAPWWEPGTASGYHAFTQGFLQGEIVRRISGRTLGNFFREEVAEPLGADFHIGLDERHDARVAELVPPKEPLGTDSADSDSVASRTLASLKLDGTEPRTAAWRRAEIPAGGGHGNARSVARVLSALACGGSVDGVRLLSEAGVERILEEQTRGVDLVTGVPLVFGMGFGLSDPLTPISPNERAFFWAGWGGSMAVVDLDLRTSVAYAMNRMEGGLAGGDLRGGVLAATALACTP
ncbi:MAG: serine hydrolase [Candidatus Binatia bacterium]|nr:serine hydrolase [Candidatus Binatia bacterium]